MNKYYIHCNNEQARYALISNAFYGRNSFDSAANFETGSFLSNNHIFISRGILGPDILAAGTSEMYSPVIVEIIVEDNSSIPVWFVQRTDSGIIVSQTISKLSEIDAIENCIGAFAFGDIPVSLISSFIFLNEKDKSNFKKPSPDLWFPQELFSLSREDIISQDITLEELKSASNQIDELLSEEKVNELQGIVRKRNKKKASLYFMVEATESWNTGAYITNVDSYLVKTLDGESTSLKEAVLKSMEIFGENESKEILENNDAILQNTEGNINNFIYDKISQLLESKKGTELIGAEEFSSWVKDMINTAPEIYKDEIAKSMLVVNGYVYTRTIDDPDEALKELSEMPVVKAFMFFLDQQMNCDFLKNSCKKLAQSERRYSYMMFALFHGMNAVDGVFKKNRLLEKRIEDVIYSELGNDYLVSSISECATLPFCEVDYSSDAVGTHGINLSIKKWYSCEKSLDILLDKADEDTLTDLYKLFGISKSSDNFLKYKEPIVITISCGDKSGTITINCDNEELSKNTEIKRTISKYSRGNSKIDFDKFKGYFANPDVYKKYYAKYSKEIQDICGSLK